MKIVREVGCLKSIAYNSIKMYSINSGYLENLKSGYSKQDFSHFLFDVPLVTTFD